MALLTMFIEGFAGEQPRHFTGCPSVDLFSASGQFPDGEIVGVDSFPITAFPDDPLHSLQTKSTWLAGVMSLALPGSGEYYSESYLKSALFFTAEVAGWIVAYTYDKKGDRQTNTFEDYADGHWSVVRYAEWLMQYGPELNPDPRLAWTIDIDRTTPGLQDWQRIQNWNQLNVRERQVGFGFTHSLPLYGEQQYYELIGKYHQYSPGWDDYASGREFLQISGRFTDYARMRGKANDYYNIASTAVSVVVVNHVISAIDAYFTAWRFNKSIQAEARLNVRHTPFGAVAETVGELRFAF